jgi:hypothetical protein
VGVLQNTCQGEPYILFQLLIWKTGSTMFFPSLQTRLKLLWNRKASGWWVDGSRKIAEGWLWEDMADEIQCGQVQRNALWGYLATEWFCPNAWRHGPGKTVPGHQELWSEYVPIRTLLRTSHNPQKAVCMRTHTHLTQAARLCITFRQEWTE